MLQVDSGDFARDSLGVKDLQAIAGPFGGALVGIGGAKNGAALRKNFIKKKGGVKADGIQRRARGRLLIVSGDQQQVGIDGIGADSVATHHLQGIAVNFLEGHGLRRLVVAQPIRVLQVAGEDCRGRNPAMERVNLLRRKLSGGFGSANGERPDLPGFCHFVLQESHAGIVGRPGRRCGRCWWQDRASGRCPSRREQWCALDRSWNRSA